jgi:hypothetical protein
MKKIIILLVVLGAGKLFLQWRQLPVDDPLNPEVIAHPVYAEVHIGLDIKSRSLELVLFAKTLDQAECQKYSQETLEKLFVRQASSDVGKWQVQSTECKTELAPRFARLFDNEPTFSTYLSMARGERHEREIRIINWGLSAEESDKVCDGLAKLQSGHKGTVKCIRAPRA